MAEFSEEQFEQLVAGERPGLIAFAIRKGVPPADAERLCQEAFITLWRRREWVHAPVKFLFGAVRRLVSAWHRERSRLDVVSMEEAARALQVPEPLRLPHTRHDGAPRFAELRDSIRQLPRRQREAVQLIWLDGLSRTDAAAALGISASTLRSHEQAALARLRM